MSVRHNIVANYLGNAWGALAQIAFVPLYIGYLGIEAYGLIGIYASMQVLLSLLDVGLTPTLTREMARFKASTLQVDAARALLRTVEIVCICVALMIFVVVFAGAHWLAANWLKAEVLPVETIVTSIKLMGVLVAMRWFSGLYRGVIMGLQHFTFATVRGAGVLLALAWISPSIVIFVLYQICISLIELLVLFRKSWHYLPSLEKANFSQKSLSSVWRFSASLSMIFLLVLLLTQADKILLSKMVPLTEFGYYALASSLASSLSMLITPISGVAYPRLTELVERGDVSAIASAYHRFSQLLTMILVPGALVLILFSDRILMLWIGDIVTVGATAHLVSLLAVGVMLNGLMNIPNCLQLAYGNTTLLVALYSALVFAFIPTIYFGVSAYGAVAAAYAVIAVNVCCIALAVPLMHRKLLPMEQWRWYCQDVTLPALAAFAAAYIVYHLAPSPLILGGWMNAFVVAVAAFFTFSASALASPLGREIVVMGWLRFSLSKT